MGRRGQGARRSSGIAGRPVKPAGADYVEEEVCVDGVQAIRRRKPGPARKTRELYLRVPMACITALGKAELSATAWPLALWVLWHHIVAKCPAAITTKFALRAGIVSRAARRYALEALSTSGLFLVSRNGTRAITVAPNATLKGLMKSRSD